MGRWVPGASAGSPLGTRGPSAGGVWVPRGKGNRCVGVADWIPRPGSDGALAPCPGKGGKRKPSEFPCYARIFSQARPGSG